MKIGPTQNFKNFKSLNLAEISIPTDNFVSKNAIRIMISGIIHINSISQSL